MQMMSGLITAFIITSLRVDLTCRPWCAELILMVGFVKHE